MCQGRYAALRKVFLIAVIALAAVLATIDAQSAEMAARVPANQPGG